MLVPENVLFALAAAASWGGGDFSGGMGVKAAGDTTAAALRLVIVAHAVSLTVLTLLCLATGAHWPHGTAMLWALAAGVAAGFSLTAFYMALARGAMGVSAAISGVLAATIPAAVSIGVEGAPGLLRLAGFALALVAIWVIAAGDSPENAGGKPTMALAITGGLGFGFYFVALRMANGLGVMEPIALARAASLITCLVLLAVVSLRRKSPAHKLGAACPGSPTSAFARWGGCPDSRTWDVQVRTPWLTRAAIGWALGVALLDTGGNLLLVAATRSGRLDVAAVLASLYPAATILLAAWRLHEYPTKRQMAGMFAALVAVVMITL
jgi:drug/metabolite transporter (DMT)-like permease